MEPIDIGPSQDCLTIADVDRDASGLAHRALVRVTKNGWVAQTWVYAHEGRGFDGLTAFFHGMNNDWRGWLGSRDWASLDGDLHLTARHDGHVQLALVLSESIAWRVTTELTVAPGEELAAAVAELSATFG